LSYCNIEEDRLSFCILFWLISFLLTNFWHFSQQFRNQRCFDTHIQSLKLFWNFEAEFARNGSNLEKRVLLKFPRNYFYTYMPVNPYHFIKKSHNHCALVFKTIFPSFWRHRGEKIWKKIVTDANMLLLLVPTIL
jgi:hypothetical protein